MVFPDEKIFTQSEDPAVNPADVDENLDLPNNAD